MVLTLKPKYTGWSNIKLPLTGGIISILEGVASNIVLGGKEFFFEGGCF